MERRESAYNRVLEVELYNGQLMLNSKHANYSFGRLHEVMKAVVKLVKDRGGKFDQVLLLGYGGGSAAKLIHDIAPEAKIDAVEIDAVVVALAKKWFYSKNVVFTIADAAEFVQGGNGKKYNLIVCDVFTDVYVPDAVRSGEFYTYCSNLLENGGIMVHNVMLKQSEVSKQSAAFESVFDRCDSFKMYGSNTVFHGILQQQ
ncbi:MAG: fused MFS/spermidine synthase [Bacteroidia bacterium]|nr:fused MFS/spermidine synthase [Bacteroidia bacterium]